MEKQLFRSRTDRVIAGVAGGLAKYFEIDVVIIRIIFVVLALANGVGILLYIIALIFIPEEPLSGKDSEKPGDKDGKAGSAGFDFKSVKDNPRDLSIIGIVLVVFGLLLTLGNVFTFSVMEVFWPLILVILGASIMVSAQRRK